MMVAKQEVADAALDGQGAAVEAPKLLDAPVAAPERPVGGNGGAGLDGPAPEIAAGVHEALRILSARCDGAFALDGQGFNRLDTAFGHDLAGRSSLTPRQAAAGLKLVRKYQRQLPPALVSILWGDAQ